MKKVKFGKVKRALRGKGFIFALALSVGAVGTATYLAYNQAITKIGGDGAGYEFEIGYGTEDEGAAVANPQEGIAMDDEVLAEPVLPIKGAAETTTEAAENANSFIHPAAPVIVPVEGQILNPFSHGELVKSKTLGVWKTHDGIDIGAPLGTEVKAMTNGTVSEIFTDPLWGICIAIDHGDGVIGCYFGLDKSVAVVVGQEVSCGDVIGAVGDTAEIEIAEESHIHFAIKKNGEWVDPEAFIAERNS